MIKKEEKMITMIMIFKMNFKQERKNYVIYFIF